MTYFMENTPLILKIIQIVVANALLSTVLVCVCVFVCVCVCVCVCVRPSTVTASSVWISWDTREQISDVMLKTLISYAKSLHRFFRVD